MTRGPWKRTFFNDRLMKRLDRNECIVELLTEYNLRVIDMTDGELEEEYTKYISDNPPYYNYEPINDKARA